MPEFEDETHFFPLKNGDPHYEAIGRVASAWAYFEFHVNQLIWRIAAIDDERGACLTSHIYTVNSRMKALLALLHLEYETTPEEIREGLSVGNYSLPNLTKKLKSD